MCLRFVPVSCVLVYCFLSATRSQHSTVGTCRVCLLLFANRLIRHVTSLLCCLYGKSHMTYLHSIIRSLTHLHIICCRVLCGSYIEKLCSLSLCCIVCSCCLPLVLLSVLLIRSQHLPFPGKVTLTLCCVSYLLSDHDMASVPVSLSVQGSVIVADAEPLLYAIL